MIDDGATDPGVEERFRAANKAPQIARSTCLRQYVHVPPGKGAGKTIVMVAKARQGAARAAVLAGESEKEIKPVLVDFVDEQATLMSDSDKGLKAAGRILPGTTRSITQPRNTYAGTSTPTRSRRSAAFSIAPCSACITTSARSTCSAISMRWASAGATVGREEDGPERECGRTAEDRAVRDPDREIAAAHRRARAALLGDRRDPQTSWRDIADPNP